MFVCSLVVHSSCDKSCASALVVTHGAAYKSKRPFPPMSAGPTVPEILIPLDTLTRAFSSASTPGFHGRVRIEFGVLPEALEHISTSTRRTGILKANKVSSATVVKDDDSRQAFLQSALANIRQRLKLRLDVLSIEANFSDGRLMDLKLEDDPLANRN